MYSKISAISHSSFFLYLLGQGKQWDYIKLQRFCTAKETINKMRRQPTGRENIFTDTCDRGLISKMYKELITLTAERTDNQVKKWPKDLNRCFSKEDTQRVNRHEEMIHITNHQRCKWKPEWTCLVLRHKVFGPVRTTLCIGLPCRCLLASFLLRHVLHNYF